MLLGEHSVERSEVGGRPRAEPVERLDPDAFRKQGKSRARAVALEKAARRPLGWPSRSHLVLTGSRGRLEPTLRVVPGVRFVTSNIHLVKNLRKPLLHDRIDAVGGRHGPPGYQHPCRS